MAHAKFSEYSSAVLGYHYYRKYWQPQAYWSWSVSMKKIISTIFFNIRQQVLHLFPMETSRVTKLLLNRDARVFATLASTNYCIWPLVKGGLETPYRIEIHMAPTVRNKESIRIYKSCVDTLYYEQKEANIVGSLESGEVSDSIQSESRKQKTDKNEARKNEKQQSTNNIRSFCCQNWHCKIM